MQRLLNNFQYYKTNMLLTIYLVMPLKLNNKHKYAFRFIEKYLDIIKHEYAFLKSIYAKRVRRIVAGIIN